MCAIFAMIQRLWHFHLCRAPLTTLIYTHYNNSITNKISTSMLTKQLRLACLALGDSVGIYPSDISVRSLCSCGAMALLCANVQNPSAWPLEIWWDAPISTHLSPAHCCSSCPPHGSTWLLLFHSKQQIGVKGGGGGGNTDTHKALYILQWRDETQM